MEPLKTQEWKTRNEKCTAGKRGTGKCAKKKYDERLSTKRTEPKRQAGKKGRSSPSN